LSVAASADGAAASAGGVRPRLASARQILKIEESIVSPVQGSDLLLKDP
jgi:hypothetical protein